MSATRKVRRPLIGWSKQMTIEQRQRYCRPKPASRLTRVVLCCEHCFYAFVDKLVRSGARPQ